MNRFVLSIAAAALVFNQPAFAADKTNYSITATWAIGGEGTCENLTVDSDAHLLYATRGSHLQVIDLDAGELAGDIPNCAAHSIALVPEFKKGFTTDGNADTVTAFNPDTRSLLYKIPTGHDPDAIIYDPFSKKIFAFDNKSADVTVIDPQAPAPLAVTAHLPLDGKPHSAISDTTGHVFVTIPNKNEIQQIDTKSMTLPNTWKLEAKSPTALAIDPQHHHLFIGCEAELIIFDTTTGKPISSTPIAPGISTCCYDTTTQTTFTSSRNGSLAVIKQTTPDQLQTVQTLQTKPQANPMALDVITHTLYLASTETPANPATTKATKPDSNPFSILVIELEK